jgi:hypothetical protein
MTTITPLAQTNKQSAAQLLCQWGTYLFIHIMTESVLILNQNYRVKSEEFQDLLARLHVGESTTEDVQQITDLHLAYYKHDTTFITNLKHDLKTMWLYAKNMDKDTTNMDMLIQTSKKNKVPVARLDCHFETNQISISSQQEPTACINHFDARTYNSHTDVCVGARVAISNVNILPEKGLYNGAMGNVLNIVYQDRSEGPNNKEHNHLPDYVVVNFPNLKLRAGIPPWDQLHKMVSFTLSLLTYPHKGIFPKQKNNHNACSTYPLP